MPLACPYCNSSRFFKAGFRVTGTGVRIQRYLCRVCGRRFSLPGNLKVELNVRAKPVEGPEPVEQLAHGPGIEVPTLEPGLDDPTLPLGEDVGSHRVPKAGKSINTLCPYDRDSRRAGSEKQPPADERAMNNPEGVAMSVLVQQPGAAQDKAGGELGGKLVDFAWWLKKQGRSEATIENYCLMLRLLVKNHADLEDPESVKEVLAKINKGLMWKEAAIRAYTAYLKMRKRTWDPPKINAVRKLPFIPTEAELDALITGCGPKTSALLRLLKETGVRVGEALRLTWSDIDMERRIITLNQPEKNGNPRIFKVSSELMGMLNRFPKEAERVFAMSYDSARTCFSVSRKRLAEKLCNPRLLRITFHTFRHWKATMEYHKSKDPLHVQQLLGHKKLDTTLLYIQVEKALFNEDTGEFTVRVAKTPEEVKELLEAGFDYICEKDGVMFFRKRK